MNIGQAQNNISNLPALDLSRYENIFKVFTADKSKNDKYYFYNIIGKVTIPSQLDNQIVDVIELNTKLPWTSLSYKLYGTQFLWWLIFLINKPENIFYAEPGKEYKYILPDYLGVVLDSIQSQIG